MGYREKQLIIERTKKLLSSISIPSLPGVLIDIKKELDEEEPDFIKITELIGRDVALSAKIINLTNSPVFRLRKQNVTTIRKALSVLGFDNFVDCVFAATLKASLKSDKITAIEFDSFYNHSIHIAKVAQVICRSIKFPKKEKIHHSKVYLAGLFHDSAIPVLASEFPDYFRTVPEEMENSKSIIKAEEKLWETNHCIAGYILSGKWNFPDHVKDTIRYHHSDELPEELSMTSRRIVSMVQLAEILVSIGGNIPESVSFPFSQKNNVSKTALKRILSDLNINKGVLENIKKDIQEINKSFMPEEDEESYEI